MMYHEKVFKEARKDDEYRAAVQATGEKFPSRWCDSLEKGIWAAGYAGWVVGFHGTEEYLRRKARWKLL